MIIIKHSTPIILSFSSIRRSEDKLIIFELWFAETKKGFEYLEKLFKVIKNKFRMQDFLIKSIK